jgi:hypothetical protein
MLAYHPPTLPVVNGLVVGVFRIVVGVFRIIAADAVMFMKKVKIVIVHQGHLSCHLWKQRKFPA